MRRTRLVFIRTAAAAVTLMIAGADRGALAANGAFAYDQATGRYGYAWNEESEKKAEAAALKGCASDTCKVVFRTKGGECGAIATTGNGKTWGGATRPKREDAEKAALANCEKQSKAGGQCKLRGSECNKK